jgi:hypothetical protein
VSWAQWVPQVRPVHPDDRVSPDAPGSRDNPGRPVPEGNRDNLDNPGSPVPEGNPVNPDNPDNPVPRAAAPS